MKKISVLFVVLFIAAVAMLNLFISTTYNKSNTLTLNTLFNVALADGEEGDDTQSCSYQKYDYVYNPNTLEYEYVVVEECTATCVLPSRPQCDQYGCTCV
ncbi:MAG: hypothetical protein ACOCWM_00645 [Cyclobacteriaceae bacterium]